MPERLHLNGTVEMPTAAGPILIPSPTTPLNTSSSSPSFQSLLPSPINYPTSPASPTTPSPTSPSPQEGRPTSSHPPAVAGSSSYQIPTVTGVTRTSPISIPTSVKPGVPGLKRRKLSPASSSSSSSETEAETRPRRSARIKRKPRRKYAK